MSTTSASSGTKRGSSSSSAAPSKRSKMVQSSLSTAFFAKKKKKEEDDENNAETKTGVGNMASEKKKNGYRVYCDLDGVLSDFDAGVVKLCGKRPDDVSPAFMWSSISRSKDFYEHLPWTSDGQDLWDAIRCLTPDILTGVSRGGAVADCKYNWCKRELCVETNHVDMAGKKKSHETVKGIKKAGVTNVITCWTKNKHKESGPRCVLIDDREKLRDEWEAAGGIFVWHTSTPSTIKQLRNNGILPRVDDDEEDDDKKPPGNETEVE